ncbi:MAG: response regulator [Deltaproteobacteria bacterium]|nr:MAG: response regulator [Deltaproteobacteria bacterium]
MAEGVRISPFMRTDNRFPASDNYFSSGKNRVKKNSRSETTLFSIVDDDESMREAIESLVESLGFRAETFASTEEFVQCDHLGQIACLILDVHLPGMSGLELQRLLSFATYAFPIIFISGRGDDRMREYALKGGAVEFLYKPFTAEALLTAVHSALKR